MQLADLGADVIKIEDPSVGGDVSRYVPPYLEGTNSLFFESFNRNKRSITLDLRRPEARGVLEDLVRVSDALVSNLRGDQPEKLRIRFADLEHVNPRLVCVSLSGFGMTGPRAVEGGYDYTVQGLAGWMQLTGGPTEPPTKSGLSLVDYCGGYVAAIATLAGVWQARRDGRGCDADLSLFETALAQLTYVGVWVASQGFEPRRMADSAHQTMVPFQAFPTADGWIMVACPKQRLWERFCDAIGRPELPGDERFADFAARDRNRDVLVPILATPPCRSARRARGSSSSRHTACRAGRSTTCSRRSTDPQAEARGDVVEYEHPALGVVRGRRPRSGCRQARPSRGRGPMLGEHTSEVLRDVCGYGEERLRGLAEAGVFGTESREEEPMSAQWRGRFLEDFAVGDVYRSRLGRTVSEADNTWFTFLTMNTNQMHFNAPYAARTEFGRAARRLDADARDRAWALRRRHERERRRRISAGTTSSCRSPVYAGDTLWAEREVLDGARVEVAPELRHRGDTHARHQPAWRSRDGVHAELPVLQARRTRGRRRVPGD